jgi:AcrR family transcriptional regulator
MPDVETPGRGRQAGAAGGEDAGLGVRSSVPPTLHPTAQKILAAARKILTERGYQSMTLQAISAEAQVNKAGVWYYFGGKQQLVLALLEDVTIRESLHFGTMPPKGATLAERVDLIVGTAAQIKERVSRFTAFYELLPEASRDAELHDHLRTYYKGWYDWATEVLAPAGGAPAIGASVSTTFGQFASILLDGIIVAIDVAAPEFDLEAALDHARRSLLLVAGDAPD